MPKFRLVKFGAAATAAAVGLILAIGSAAAHSTPSGGVSVSVSATKAALKTNYPWVAADPASNALRIEQETDAIEAAEKAAALAAEQAKEAAELAAQQAASSCQTTDTPEDTSEKDTTEKSADQTEDTTTEPAAGSPADVTEDATEKAADMTEDAAERAADATEDASEPKCPEAPKPETTSTGDPEHHSSDGGSPSSWNQKKD